MTEPLTDREAEDLREHFEERAAILEHDAGLPKAEAELEAARITATLARNRAYQGASLRSALSGYPDLASQVPATPGTVDSLPLGTARVHVREGAKPPSSAFAVTSAVARGWKHFVITSCFLSWANFASGTQEYAVSLVGTLTRMDGPNCFNFTFLHARSEQ